MIPLSDQDLIYDWNAAGETFKPAKPVELDDETLRDGQQSPSVFAPSLDEKVRLLNLMESLGIESADIGLPGAGPHVVAHVLRLAREIADNRMKIAPNCAARTVAADIIPIIDISQKAGIAIEVACFIGSSPIRQYAEDWSLDHLLRLTESAVSLAVKNGLPVMYVTEDTTRGRPEVVRAMYTAAVNTGARRVCVCDTVGHATPRGARNLIRFVRDVVAATGVPDVKIDWHGHQDRGLGLANSLAAAEAGADRLHGCALGIGERVGNTPLDHLLVNMQLLGWIDRDLTRLAEYCQLVSTACRVPIPDNYPVMGRDAFRTGTGVHAAAIIKAKRKGDDWLADRVYSGVPASMVGQRQLIEVGPMCGESNVVFWLDDRGIPPDRDLVKAIFARAKDSDHVLNDVEVLEICQTFAAGHPVA